MLIYVIPFILLLVIAVVLKKRETGKQAEQTSTAKAKKVSSTKKTPQKTQIVSDPVVEKKKTTALAEDVRNKIGTLISAHNFFAAEAQINQALNKDNSQHELYLLLLDIHILQKDEFAINQLINHLRSLELDDFLEQALAKKAAHDQQALSSRDTIDFKMESSAQTAIEQPAVEQKNTADFDALMSNNSAAPSVTANDVSFDQLQQETRPSQKDHVEEIKPLDFNTFSLDQAPITTAKTEVPISIVEEIKPLDFSSLSLDPTPTITAKPEPTPVVEEIQPLDFSFSLDTPAVEQSAQPAEETIPFEVAAVEEKAEFDFNFSLTETVAPVEAKTVAEETTPSLDLEFNLEPATPNEPLSIETAPAKSSGVSFDISNISSSASQADQNDPLMLSFPELIDVNEISLNLELAAQYIQLGAFESAHELLIEHEAEYTTEQRQQADQLRNQIAS
ncbi:hypothetical protein [Acinetobacter kyonggiensis]|uniref:FimV C-terminal domain-containing protein n=1 Tax=Acinetobacter kyonggiensis TaxID=595670 RepID=A0A1H3FNJ4_9GAMM|nr:hypothetical protein [Acinetobacter kyonggiensis]SDX91704.1 hypothetical protein SAMN05421643_101158 [Acinetobacter kyonggiensis]